MKAKFLRYSINLSAIVCLVLFITVKVPGGDEIFKHKMVEYYGDLYRQNYINHFDSILIPYGTLRPEFVKTNKQTNINEADVLFYGDSFSFIRTHTTLPEQISDALVAKVFFDDLNEFNYQNNPFQSFVNYNYQKKGRRLLIFESGEGALLARFFLPMDPTPQKKLIEKGSFRIIDQEAEKKYTKLLQTSTFSHSIYSAIATLKFDFFGYIPKYTAHYSLDPPWLFNSRLVNVEHSSYKVKRSDKEIDDLCDKILFLQQKLDELYNVDFLFVPVPNKITIYGSIIGETDYNNFLPLIYDKLAEKGVNYVDLYHPFMNSDTVLYYPTDTHWNNSGTTLATKEIVKRINELGIYHK